MHAPRLRSRAPLPRALLCLTGLLACAGEPEERVQLGSHGTDCAACHLDEWRETRAPAHATFGFGERCESCHVEERWSPASGYAHVSTFPLTLGHAEVACAQCHTSGFAPGATPSACAACHAGEAARVVDPVHAALSSDCFACHRTASFAPAFFIHAWPLKGVHALTSCRSCHQGEEPQYEGISSACVSCHADDYSRANTQVPGHAQFGADCAGCHGFSTFKR